MSSISVRVETVITGRQNRDFLRFPYALHANLENWVPPLRRDEKRRWSPDTNPALRYRRHARFLAQVDGRVVGRLAAIVDPLFTERWGAATGFFGFFESVDDVEVAKSLFCAAEDYLRKEGMSKMMGPVNLTTNDEVGLLVDGFQYPPTVLAPYNPPYFVRLLEENGHTPGREFHAYTMDPSHSLAPEADRLIRSYREKMHARGISIRTADPGEWKRDKRLVFELYNVSFSKVWGFVPLRWDEFDERAESFRPFHRSELVVFAVKNGKEVGFALVLPDINTILRGMGGRMWPVGWLRLLRGIPRLRTGRYILLGVHPQHLGNGLALLLGDALRQNGARLGYTSCELSVVRDGNRHVEHAVTAFGGIRTKTYRLYEKALT